MAVSRSAAPSTVLPVSAVPARAAVSPATAGSIVRMTAARVLLTRDCDQLSRAIAAALARTARKRTLPQVAAFGGSTGSGELPVTAAVISTTSSARPDTVTV